MIHDINSISITPNDLFQSVHLEIQEIGSDIDESRAQDTISDGYKGPIEEGDNEEELRSMANAIAQSLVRNMPTWKKQDIQSTHTPQRQPTMRMGFSESHVQRTVRGPTWSRIALAQKQSANNLISSRFHNVWAKKQ